MMEVPKENELLTDPVYWKLRTLGLCLLSPPITVGSSGLKSPPNSSSAPVILLPPFYQAGATCAELFCCSFSNRFSLQLAVGLLTAFFSTATFKHLQSPTG